MVVPPKTKIWVMDRLCLYSMFNVSNKVLFICFIKINLKDNPIYRGGSCVGHRGGGRPPDI